MFCFTCTVDFSFFAVSTWHTNTMTYYLDVQSRLECVDEELRGPLAQRCAELYNFNVKQRTRHECQYVLSLTYLLVRLQ